MLNKYNSHQPSKSNIAEEHVSAFVCVPRDLIGIRHKYKLSQSSQLLGSAEVVMGISDSRSREVVFLALIRLVGDGSELKDFLEAHPSQSLAFHELNSTGIRRGINPLEISEILCCQHCVYSHLLYLSLVVVVSDPCFIVIVLHSEVYLGSSHPGLIYYLVS